MCEQLLWSWHKSRKRLIPLDNHHWGWRHLTLQQSEDQYPNCTQHIKCVSCDTPRRKFEYSRLLNDWHILISKPPRKYQVRLWFNRSPGRRPSSLGLSGRFPEVLKLRIQLDEGMRDERWYGCWTKNSGIPNPKNGWWKFHGSNPIKMDDLGVKPPLFLVQHPYHLSSKNHGNMPMCDCKVMSSNQPCWICFMSVGAFKSLTKLLA